MIRNEIEIPQLDIHVTDIPNSTGKEFFASVFLTDSSVQLESADTDFLYIGKPQQRSNQRFLIKNLFVETIYS